MLRGQDSNAAGLRMASEKLDALEGTYTRDTPFCRHHCSVGRFLCESRGAPVTLQRSYTPFGPKSPACATKSRPWPI